MRFFFVKDRKQNYRFISSDPAGQVPVQFSRTRKIWETAKKKLLLLPPRILRQEEAFGKALKHQQDHVEIWHSGCLDEQHVRSKFRFFLYKQRTSRTLLLAGEALLLPFSGLAALLPGPNVAFYILALIMVTQWQSLRGIRRLLRLNWIFRAEEGILAEWEKAVSSKRKDDFPGILDRAEKALGVEKIQKIL